MVNIGHENAQGHQDQLHQSFNHNHISTLSLSSSPYVNGVSSTLINDGSGKGGPPMAVPNCGVASTTIPKQQSSTTMSSTDPSNSGPKKLRLLSPVGAEAAEYDWPLVVSNKFNPAQEIIETIKLVAEEFSDLKLALEKNVLTNYNTSSYEKMKNFCDKYNKVIKESLQMWKGTSIQTEKRPTTELLSHIMQMCYNSSVGDPQKLNKFYEPFSPEVYGETSFKFVQQMIDEIGINEDDIFIDLGSGIGQVVLHVAAAVNCVKCIGIEKADLPGNYADKMQVKFRFWMNWFGRTYSDFELYRGDFFNTEYKDIIQNSDFIFVNNFAFGPEVDHKLKIYFVDLKDGAKILSSKAFCSLNFRYSQRNLNDIGAIMKVKEIMPLDNQSVSWTGKPVSYFLHTIDRKQLALYFEKSKSNRFKNKKCKQGGDGSPNDDDSSNDPRDENSIPSKWTRKAWAEYISSQPSGGDGGSSARPNVNIKSSIIPNGYVYKNSIPMMTDNGDIKQVQQHKDDPNKNKRSRGRPRKSRLEDKVDCLAQQDSQMDTSHENELSTKDNDLNDGNDDLDGNDVGIGGDGDLVQNATAPSNRRGRPKKKKILFTKKKIKGINLNSLNMLHEKTVLSTAAASTYTAPPPGCVEQRLCSKLDENTVSVPNITVINKDIIQEEIVTPPVLSPYFNDCDNSKNNKNFNKSDNNENVQEFNGMKLCKPVNLSELLFLFGHQVNSFNNFMKSKEFIDSLKQSIVNYEKTIGNLNYQINTLNKQIYEDNYNLKRYLKDLNIESSQDLITKIEKCSEEIENLKKQMHDINQWFFTREEQLKDLTVEFKQIEERKREENKRNQLKMAELAATIQLQSQNVNSQQNVQKNQVVEQQQPEPEKVESSPKINFKEMKYKKYLSNETKRQNNVESPQVSAPSTPTPPLSSNDAINNDGVKSSDAIKIDVNRINSVIMKGFNEENKLSEQSVNQQTSTPVASSSKSGQKRSSAQSSGNSQQSGQNKRGRKKENKIETYKMKKGDRETIMNGGRLQTIVNRKNSETSSNDNASSKNDSSSNSKQSAKSSDPSEKPFPFKLKINCKESKVKILNDSENVTETFEKNKNNGNTKRKLSSSDHQQSNNVPNTTSINKRTRTSEKQDKDKNKDNNIKSDSPAELKRPSVVIKLGSNGQYYSQTSLLDDDEEENDDDEQTNTNNKKTSTRNDQAAMNETASECSTINHHIKTASAMPADNTSMIINKSPSIAPPLPPPASSSSSSSRSSSTESSHQPNSPSRSTSKSSRKSRCSKSQKSLSSSSSSSSSTLSPHNNTNNNSIGTSNASHNNSSNNDNEHLYQQPTANMYSQATTPITTNQSTLMHHQKQTPLPSQQQVAPQPSNNGFAVNYTMNLFNMTVGSEDNPKNYFNTNGYLAANGIAGHHANFGANDFYNSLKNSPQTLFHNVKESLKSSMYARNVNYGQLNNQNQTNTSNNCSTTKETAEQLMHQYGPAAAALINHHQQQNGGGGFDYGGPSISCRYDNHQNQNTTGANTNDFMTNAAASSNIHQHLAAAASANNLDSLINNHKNVGKNHDQTINNTNKPFYNPNVIF